MASDEQATALPMMNHPPAVMRMRGLLRPLAATPLLPVAAAAILGIALADAFRPPLWTGVAAFLTCLLLFIGAAWRRPAPRSQWLTWLCVSSAFAVLHLVSLAEQHLFPFAEALERHAEMSVTADGVVVGEPQSRGERVEFVLRLDGIEHDGAFHTAWHRILAVYHGDAPEYGDRLRVRGTLRSLRSARNPGQFDRSRQLRREGIVARIDLERERGPELKKRAQGNPLVAFAQKSRRWIQATITRDLEDSPDVVAVLSAMVLGDKSATSQAIETDFRHSGALHIFAVSGLHVGILAAVLWFSLRFLGVRRTPAVLIAIPCLLFYALVTGLRPSALRAAVMASIVMGGIALLRPPRLLNSLAAAAIIILAIDSQQLFLPGFQLSFTVLFSIALLATPFQRPLRRWLRPDPFLPPTLVPKSRRAAASMGTTATEFFCVSAAAWLGSLPLVLWHFRLVTPIALLSNCFLVPMALVILPIATMSAFTAAFGLTPISVILNNANWFFTKALLALCTFFAWVPGGHFYVRPEVLLSSDDATRVEVLDTGYAGGAQVITVAESQRSLLIDAAGPYTVREVLLPFLRWQGIQQIDDLVLTHGDAQHLGGAVSLLENVTLASVTGPGAQTRSPFYPPFLDALENHGYPPPRSLFSGDLVFADSRSSLQVLYPPRDLAMTAAIADDRCLVLQLRCDGWTLLFVSDAGFAAEKWLLKNARDQLASHVLIKGRHRSDFSGLPEFVDAVLPAAIISTHDSFPEAERIPADWKKLLTGREIALFDQSETGAVRIRCTPDELRIESFLTDQSCRLHAREP